MPKPFLSITDQINKLRDKNLIVKEESNIEFYLKNISYHRLMSYRFAFEDNPVGNSPIKFKNNTTFENILKVYFDDLDFKNNLFNILLSIELTFRTYIIEELANENYFTFISCKTKNQPTHKKSCPLCFLRKKLESRKLKIKENGNFNAHLKYQLKKKDKHLPCWIAVETLEFGELRKLFDILDQANKIILQIT